MANDAGTLAVTIDECKAHLRLERDDEDAELAGFIRTATAMCEAFTGQWLIVREGQERLASSGCWQRLSARPVVAVLGVDGGAGPLAPTAYEADIDRAGTASVRLRTPFVNQPVVHYRAGIGADWNGVHEPLRHGVVRLVAHLFAARDAADAGPPPAAVAAMWRPWRVVRLA